MENKEIINGVQAELDAALEQQQWRRVGRCYQRLAAILVAATVARDEETVALVDDLFTGAYDDLVVDNDLAMTPGFEAMAWQSSAYGTVSGLARRNVPTRTPAQRAARLANARTRILEELGAGNGEPLSNSEIAARTGLHVATVARALVELRAAKEVVCWRDGKMVMNQIAAGADARNRALNLVPIEHQFTKTVDRKSAAIRPGGVDIAAPPQGIFIQSPGSPQGKVPRVQATFEADDVHVLTRIAKAVLPLRTLNDELPAEMAGVADMAAIAKPWQGGLFAPDAAARRATAAAGSEVARIPSLTADRNFDATGIILHSQAAGTVHGF